MCKYTYDDMKQAYNDLSECSKIIIDKIVEYIINKYGAIGLKFDIDIYALAINLLNMPRDKNIYDFIDNVSNIIMSECIETEEDRIRNSKRKKRRKQATHGLVILV